MATQRTDPPAPAISRVVVRSLVRTRFERPPKELVAAVARADVTTLSELVGRMYTMHHSIRPLAGAALPLLPSFWLCCGKRRRSAASC